MKRRYDSKFSRSSSTLHCNLSFFSHHGIPVEESLNCLSAVEGFGALELKIFLVDRSWSCLFVSKASFREVGACQNSRALGKVWSIDLLNGSGMTLFLWSLLSLKCLFHRPRHNSEVCFHEPRRQKSMASACWDEHLACSWPCKVGSTEILIPSPRNFLPIPGKELPVVFDAHIINDSKKLLNRVLTSEKLPFWHVALEWLGEVCIYSPGME
jgi:hypothetical protein